MVYFLSLLALTERRFSASNAFRPANFVLGKRLQEFDTFQHFRPKAL
jgi:hypothetical protein